MPKYTITEEYVLEKVEAYNVAIETLRMHEPASDCDLAMAAYLREELAQKLDREIQRWYDKNKQKIVKAKNRSSLTDNFK